jgi:hypothetical protein
LSSYFSAINASYISASIKVVSNIASLLMSY